MRGRWEERIGSLIPDAHDKWRRLDRDTDTNALAADVIASIRDYALPAIRTHIG